MDEEPHPSTVLAEHPSAFDYERVVAHDLAPTRGEEVERHARECAPCGKRLAALRADVSAFRAEVPLTDFAARHRQRQRMTRPALPRRARRWFSDWRFAAPAMTGMAAVALLGVNLLPTPRPAESTVAGTTPQTRIKGSGIRLGYLLLRRTGGTIEFSPGAEGAVRRAGDEIVLTMAAPLRYGYMAVVGVDGRGEVSTYYPASADLEAAQLGPIPSSGRLPNTLILDVSQGAERLFAVFSREPIPLARVLAAAYQIAGADMGAITRLPLGDEFAQDSTWFEKQ